MNSHVHDRLRSSGHRASAAVGQHRLRRFVAVGALGVGVNSLALFALHGAARIPLFAASVLAAEVAVAHNYLLNELWTFRSRRPSISRFLKFNVTALLALLLNASTVWMLVGLGLFYLLANLFGIVIALVVNFTATATWIWGGVINSSAPHWPPGGGVPPTEHPGGVHALHDDLHMGPARRGRSGAGARAPRRALTLVHRGRAGTPRRGSHRQDPGPGRSQQLPRCSPAGHR